MMTLCLKQIAVLSFFMFIFFHIYMTTYLFTIEPQAPGPIDTNSSNFHPQTLHLKWAKSENSSYVNMYYITINGRWQYTSLTTLTWGRDLEPGMNYTVLIYAICWYHDSYSKWSPVYAGKINTLRKWFVLQNFFLKLFSHRIYSQLFFFKKALPSLYLRCSQSYPPSFII